MTVQWKRPFGELIASLKSAMVKDDEYCLDKEKSAFNDLYSISA